MNIDHHLQKTILESLASSDDLVRYGDLKPGDIENSLFSYHLNKLIDRGMVDKSDDGYALSIEGARWLNDNGLTLRAKELPRVMVALVVQNEAGLYLVGQRLGQFKTMINDYMLPTVQYTSDVDLEQQTDEAMARYLLAAQIVQRANFGFVQIKATYNDDRIMRNLFYVTRCNVKALDGSPIMIGRNHYDWMDWDTIMQLDHPSATILRSIIDYTQDDHHRHDTPLFAG